MWNYKYHIEADRCLAKDRTYYLSQIPERVTKLSFAQWKVFYNADPENWINFIGNEHKATRCMYQIPVYKKIINHKEYEYIYIKFLTPYDYKQYIDFIREIEGTGQDYQNTKEVLELSEVIKARAAARTKKLQEETAKAYKENQEIYKRIMKDISIYGNRGLYDDSASFIDSTGKKLSYNDTLRIYGSAYNEKEDGTIELSFR